MTTMRQRERVLSPPRFRRQTIGMVYSPPNSQSVPNSARHSTPRPRSALDRKWVHRSQGDLTLDMDMQVHPRLQSEFYQELYQKYPHAFRRRLESREAGRKLFNSCLHVRFKDDTDVSDDNYSSHGNLGNFHSNTHLTNWDREVGHYIRHKSRSKECVTSVDASECSGSVLSVSQRLKLNSQSLNKLLNEDLPFRKHAYRENGQYDSGTENEQSLQDYMLEKSKERSRHRKQQRRIIIQRKIHKNDSVEVNKENERNSRRWMSKSVSPSQHLFRYSLPHTNLTNETHPVNVESLIADSDLKIDTLLEKINSKMSGPESPPDSAIDVDSPSVQSLIAPDPKGSILVKQDTELPALNGEETGSFESPGSSASAYVADNSAKIDDIMQEKVSTETVQCSNDSRNVDNLTSEKHITINDCKKDISEEDEMNRIVEKYGSLDNLNQNTGSGLLQLYTVDMGNENVGIGEFHKDSSEHLIGTSKDGETPERSADGIKVENEKMTTYGHTTSVDLDNIDLDKAESDIEKNVSKMDIDGAALSEEDIKQDLGDTVGTKSAHFVEQVDYNADDEQEADVVMTDAINSNNAAFKRFNTHRESDVDSGIGYSSTGTDTLPPRGRAQQREATMKHQPFKADHSLLPLKSEVDVDILDEVNLVHLSHDLLKSHDYRGRRGNSVTEERDDTDIRLGISKASEKDKKIAEKYRRARSPSPYILRNLQSPAGCRPKSAPLFAQSELDLRVVEIPLSENSILASAVAQNPKTNGNISHSQPKSTKNSNTSSKTNSCQNSDIISKYSSLPNLTGNQSRHSKTHSSNNSSSRLVKQRKCSISSISSEDSSISLLSENEADLVTHACNLSYDDGIEDEVHSPEGAFEDNYAKEIEEENFTEMELNSGTNIENLVEERPSELKKMIKGMYQPAVTSPRVKEKRLKIRNILKQRKGTFSPPEDSKKPVDEKNAVNRIYAKSRDSAGYENVTKRQDASVPHAGIKASFEVFNANIDSNKATDRLGIDQTKAGNSVKRTTPFESATSAGRDTESVDKFISGDSNNTVIAEPVIFDPRRKPSESDKPNIPSDNLKNVNVQIERAVSPAKAQPPQKPVRTKHKNKNLNVLADQLNFSKYKIKVDEGQTATLESNLRTRTEKSERSPRSHSSTLPGQSSNPSKAGQAHLNRETSGESEIEEWKPLPSNMESEQKVEKKRGSKRKFKMFKKALSMDRGIETVGIDPNPTGQNPQTSKDSHSNFPKVKKNLSLKSFTSLFNRKKKKKGQFVIEDVENAGKHGSPLGRNEPTHTLSNGKQKHWASCHSLETMNSPIHHQPIRKQDTETSSTQHEIQPMGKLLKINPDGTQMIKLIKPENGPMGFFIAKGSAKFGNGIFVSRFAETRSEQSFAGLLGIGDEIIEVNNHVVRDLSQDAVYNLMSGKSVLLVKVFPFIARKDV